MAAEGVFPKVDGDVLYASEINGLHYGNGAKDILPTESGAWGTSPTGLANITDEDTTTATNSFTQTVDSGSPQTGYINIDLANNKVRSVIQVKLDYDGTTVPSAGNYTISFQTSQNNSDWVNNNTLSYGNTSGSIDTAYNIIPSASKFRYFRVTVSSSHTNPATTTTKIYQVNII